MIFTWQWRWATQIFRMFNIQNTISFVQNFNIFLPKFSRFSVDGSEVVIPDHVTTLSSWSNWVEFVILGKWFGVFSISDTSLNSKTLASSFVLSPWRWVSKSGFDSNRVTSIVTNNFSEIKPNHFYPFCIGAYPTKKHFLAQGWIWKKAMHLSILRGSVDDSLFRIQFLNTCEGVLKFKILPGILFMR